MGWLDSAVEFTPEMDSVLDDLATDLKRRGTHVMFSSPLRRALDTACRLTNGLVEVDVRLREWGLGVWEGKTHYEVQREYPDWFDGSGVWDPRQTPPGGESFAEVERRVRQFLFDRCPSLSAPLESESTVIITHNGIIRMIRYICGEIPESELFRDSEPSLQALQLRLPT